MTCNFDGLAFTFTPSGLAVTTSSGGFSCTVNLDSAFSSATGYPATSETANNNAHNTARIVPHTRVR